MVARLHRIFTGFGQGFPDVPALSTRRHCAAKRRFPPDPGRRPLRQIDGRRRGIFRFARGCLSRVSRGLPPTRQAVGRRHRISSSAATSSIPGWAAARMFVGGPAPWFDFRVYNEALRANAGRPYPEHYWSYPPHVVLFIWPFGLMPYLPAYIAWCAIGIALYLFACSERHPARAAVVPRGRARHRGMHLFRPERLLHRGTVDRRFAQSRAPAGAGRHSVRHSHHQAAARPVVAGGPAARAALADDRVGGGDDGCAGRADRDAVRLGHLD